ncbi:non-ribosomal peptide synthetase [Saccharomonospora azurea]
MLSPMSGNRDELVSAPPTTEPPLRRLIRAVAAHPDRIAVSAMDGELSFVDLRDRITSLSELFTSMGAGRGSRVGIHLPRSVDLIPAMLAAWWIGGAFVPLDPLLPAARLAAISRRARVDLVVSTADELPWQSEVPVVRPDTAGAGSAVPLMERERDDLAYAIFTSGTTGVPKGVEVTVGGVADLLWSLEESGVYPLEPRRVACNASIVFDASVQQWLRVCRGDTVHVIDAESRLDAAGLAALLRDNELTDLDATPSHWTLLCDVVSTVRRPLRLYLGGEPIPEGMWSELVDLVRDGRIEAVYNLYGPTECTVDVTATLVSDSEPHIGEPLPGRRVYVLDGCLRPTDANEPGELYVGGVGLARGYTDDPTQTAARFVADPFGSDGSRMYRTGDRVRRRPDGSLAYLDRIDRQVKVGGHRIELGEIEAALAVVPGVDRVMVTLAERALVAFYTSVAETVSTEVVREHLSAVLPAVLVPTLVPIDSFPLTTSGKIDVKALIDTALPAELSSVDGEVPALIAGVWSDVLGLPSVSATDDFFALGGHSLVALHVVAQVRERLGVRISTRDVYRYPRLSDLAAYVEARRGFRGRVMTDRGEVVLPAHGW